MNTRKERMMDAMNDLEFKELMTIYKGLWPGSNQTTETINAWYMAVGKMDFPPVSGAIRDHKAYHTDHKPPAPGAIRKKLSKEKVPGEVESSPMPPYSPKIRDFAKDMRKMMGSATTREKMEIMYKWGGIDQEGHPIASGAVRSPMWWRDQMEQEVKDNGILSKPQQTPDTSDLDDNLPF